MSVKILRINDRVPVKIDEITVSISPLTYKQKIEIQDCGFMITNSGLVQKQKFDINKMIFLVLKFTVKDVEGLEDIRGNKYKLEFEDEDKQSLTDECVEDLLNVPMKNKMSLVLMQLMNGLPDDGRIRNPENPKEFISGVEILIPEKKQKAAGK